MPTLKYNLYGKGDAEMEIGERIRRKREALGMSQDELAKKCGYASRVSISKIESDSRGLPIDKVTLIAKALRVTPAYLMGWEDEDGNEIVDDEHTYIIETFQQLNDKNRKRLVDYLEMLMIIQEGNND